MRRQMIQPILAPKTLVIIGYEERCSEGAGVHSILKVRFICLCTRKESAVGKRGIETGGIKAGLDHGIFGNVLLFRPAGPG